MNLHKCRFFLVNGILTKPEDIWGWTDRAERWYEDRDLTATRYEYFSGAITRFLGQGRRVREIIAILNEIHRPIIYVGHSNGCELFSRVIRESGLRFEAAHLFSAATDCDFETNGFNRALRENRIGRLYLYGSANDDVLRRGNRVTGWLRRFGLGYGCLGWSGPENVAPDVASRVEKLWRDENKHSTWFAPVYLDSSLSLTLRTEAGVK